MKFFERLRGKTVHGTDRLLGVLEKGLPQRNERAWRAAQGGVWHQLRVIMDGDKQYRWVSDDEVDINNLPAGVVVEKTERYETESD